MEFANNLGAIGIPADKLQQVVSVIRHNHNCLAAFLVGICGNERYAFNAYHTAQSPHWTDKSYFILVVVSELARAPEANIQSVLENRLNESLQATVMVINENQFRSFYEEGRHFMVASVRDGQVLLDNDGFLAKLGPQPYILQHEPIFHRWRKTIDGCLSGALYFKSSRQLGLAAFLLHQAAAQLFIAHFQAATGYTIFSHNLDKLRRFNQFLTPAIQVVFPMNNLEEVNLFESLRKAYFDGRYDAGYELSESCLDLLVTRVQMLMSLVTSQALVG